MKRREFIKNSALVFGAGTLLVGCSNKNEIKSSQGKVLRRKFGNTTISLLGLGGLAFFPMKEDKQVDMVEFENLIAYAMQHGANYFDTANIIINEKWQRAIGQLLKNYPRESYMLGNKMPTFLPKTKKDVKEIFDKQLKDCGVEYFDNYSISCIVKNTLEHYQEIDMYDQLLEFKKEGKIRHIGFAGPGLKILKEIIDEYEWDYGQLKLNYLGWDEDNMNKVHEIISQKNIPIIATEPLRGNILAKLPEDVEKLIKQKCPKDSQVSYALRWVASKNNVVSVLCDMSKIEQLKENVDTFSNYMDLNKNEIKVANNIAAYIHSKNIINCTTCKSCLDFCPNNINIPAIFFIYNKYKISNKPNKGNIFVAEYNKINKSSWVNKCMACSACSKHCPKRLNIPNLLKEVHNAYLSVKDARRV